VVLIVEGVTRAVNIRAEETVNRGGASIEMIPLAIEEVKPMVITEVAGSTINIGELGLVVISRLARARAKDTVGMETSSLIGSNRDSIFFSYQHSGRNRLCLDDSH